MSFLLCVLTGLAPQSGAVSLKPVDAHLVFPESSKEQFASTNIAEELVRLFQKQAEHDKKEMIFEVLAPLAENGNFA